MKSTDHPRSAQPSPAALGYVKLYRSLQAHWLYESRPFCELGAWLDLLLRAAWRPHQDRHGRTQGRGEIFSSQLQLAEAWGWTRQKVQRFLARLEQHGMAQVKTDRSRHKGGTFIRVVNYDRFQGDGDLPSPSGEREVMRKRAQSVASKRASNPIGKPRPKRASKRACSGHLAGIWRAQQNKGRRKEGERTTAPSAPALKATGKGCGGNQAGERAEVWAGWNVTAAAIRAVGWLGESEVRRVVQGLRLTCRARRVAPGDLAQQRIVAAVLTGRDGERNGATIQDKAAYLLDTIKNGYQPGDEHLRQARALLQQAAEREAHGAENPGAAAERKDAEREAAPRQSQPMPIGAILPRSWRA